MSYWIAVAGALSFGFLLLHVIGGGAEVHVPMLEAGLSRELHGFVSVLWHGFTVSMLLCSVLFLMGALRAKARTLLTLIPAIQYAGFAAIFLLYNWVRFDSLFVMPQWIGFAVIVLIALIGLWRDTRAESLQTQIR